MPFPSWKSSKTLFKMWLKKRSNRFWKHSHKDWECYNNWCPRVRARNCQGLRHLNCMTLLDFQLIWRHWFFRNTAWPWMRKTSKKKWTSKKRVHVPPLKLRRKTGWSSSMMRNKNLSDMNCFQHLFGLFVTEKSPISMATYISWFSISRLFTQKVEVKSAIRAIWKHPTEM